MKNLYLLLLISVLLPAGLRSQSFCPNNLVSNPQFSNSLTNWTQYGLVPTATVLNAQNGCLDTFLIMQATNNSNCGVSQVVPFRQDSCYSLCYCVEFPFTGSLFNTKLTVAAITSGITVTQLLTGSFTPAQAQIIDVITATNGVAPVTQCPPVFQATGNFTELVIVNETIGAVGTDVRVDNICLLPHACGPDCANVNAGFTYTVGPGTTVNFTDISTSNPGDVLSWTWDFGDPPSGPNNTSALQNPTHTYPGPGIYFVCMYLNVIMSNGLPCQDTFCIDVVVSPTVGLDEPEALLVTVSPNPARDHVRFSGNTPVTGILLINLFGQVVMESAVVGNECRLPSELKSGLYTAVLQTEQGRVVRKIMIRQ